MSRRKSLAVYPVVQEAVSLSFVPRYLPGNQIPLLNMCKTFHLILPRPCCKT
jgi:hypothetical protein